MTEKTEKKPMQTILLRLHVLRPDKREFKQQSTELFSPPDKNIMIAVQVPCTKDYIFNAMEINAEVLGTGDISDPILTPEGLFYIHQEFEKFFSDPKDEFELVPATEDEDWDNETEPSKSDEGWEEDSSDESEDWGSTEDDSWDEDDEGWEE